MITHPSLDHPSLMHGFFTRMGGVSGGVYASLNVGVGSDDDARHVLENRAIAARAFGVEPEALATVKQVHSARVVEIDSVCALDAREQADAMVTRNRGIMLGILTADCAPVLFADVKAGVIGAAHAGWKGAVSGVLEATIETMTRLGARREQIVAVVGPSIAQASYEVGQEFYARLTEMDAQNHVYFVRGTAGHWQFNLPGYVEARLTRAGLRAVSDVAMDTLTDEQHFFSYRRKTLRAEVDYGRQLSAIMLAT